MTRLWLVLAVSVLAPPSFVPAQDLSEERRWVDGVVAIVGSTSLTPDAIVVLESDVQFLLALFSAGQGRITRGAAVEQLTGEALIAREAKRVRVPPPDADARRQTRERLLHQLGGSAAVAARLQSLGAAESEFERLVTRRATVTQFLQANLEATSRVPEALVRARYDQGNHPFLDQPYAEAAGPLQAWMRQRRLSEAVKRWVGVLRSRDIIHQPRS